jgi:hypothetical protein
MNKRVGRTRDGVKSGWLWARAAVCSLVVGLGSVGAVATVAADDVVVETGDSTGPQSLTLGNAMPDVQAPVHPDAPSLTGCPITVLPNDGGFSENERAPNLRNRFGRSVYLITASELAAAGFTNGTGISGIGWSFQVSPGLSGTNNLIVYMQNTADATNLKSTTWATAITGMTVVHNAATTIPNVTGSWDITFSGGSAFTYTGGGLYVAFDAQYPVGTLSVSTVVWCNSSGLIGGLKGAQGASAPTTIAASDFRPETRLAPTAATILNDASVEYVISYGSLAQPLVGPQTVHAVVTNKGADPLTNLPVTFNLTGAETFTDTQVVPNLGACGGTATVTFAPFTPSAIGSDTVTMTVPADQVAGNDSKSRPLDETLALYSYKHPGTTAAGGAGLTGATGAFVGKFNITAAAKVSEVHLEFFATSATTYRVAIYPDSGSGTPGTVPLYVDAADRTVAAIGPVTITLPTPVLVGPGNFYAGIQQTNTTNATLSFDNEAPIRFGAFYLASPNPPTVWVDFFPGNNFKLNIGVTVMQCTTVADCDDNNACTNDACTNTRCTHTNNTNPCNDNNACTANDRCSGGACVADPPLVCPSDGILCTTEACVPATGACVSTNNTNPCNDGNACTTGDACGPNFTENFDGVTPPNLPGTWSSSETGQGNIWSTVFTSSDTAPNSVFGFDVAAVADEVLISPPINIATATAQLTFRNRWNFEWFGSNCYDAGVLEISFGGGSFTDIVTAGGSFVSGGYTGTVSALFNNPLGARSAWCGESTGYPAYLTSVVNLPAAAAGQTIRLRWRIGTDMDFDAPGQNIDSIGLADGINVCKPGAVASPPEVQNVAASANKTTYTWSAAASATRYDVVRGRLSGLPVGPGGGDEVCFGNLAGTTLNDATVPGAGIGFWYLSRGENNCGNGTYGRQGLNGAPGAPRTTTTCP